jgi:hypothetical protein
MFRKESGFIPLPKIEQEQPEEDLEIKLNLPQYVDQDRIGINTSNIIKLNNWGGIRTLRVVGRYDMETSILIPETAGINSDGSANASKKVTKVEKPTFEGYSSDYNWDTFSIANRWKNVEINLNIDEIGQRIKDKPEGIRSSKNWTRELDSGINRPLRAEGHKNLLHDLEFLDKYSYRNIVIVGGLISSIYYANSGHLTLGGFLGFYLGDRIVTLVKSINKPELRLSLFPGYQIDRAVVLSAMSRLKTIVKDLGSDN